MKIFLDLARLQLFQVLTFGSLLLGVFYFTLYDDGTQLEKLIAGVQGNIDQVEVNIKKKEEELEEVKNFEKEVIAQEEVIKYFLNFIPESLTYTDLSSLLIKAAEFTGINIEVKQDQRVHSQEEKDYQTLKIQLAVDGSFSQIMFFLSKLTEQKRMLILNKIDMNIDQGSSLIKAKMRIIAYRYYKPKQPKKEDEDEEAGA